LAYGVTPKYQVEHSFPLAAEVNYTVSEQELLAIVHALRIWRCYLEGCNGLRIVTDHKPISYMDGRIDLSRRQARWAEFLSRFDYELVYRPGRSNVADPLSRLRVCAITRSLARTIRNSDVDGTTVWPTNVSDAPNTGPDGATVATAPPCVSKVEHDNSPRYL